MVHVHYTTKTQKRDKLQQTNTLTWAVNSRLATAVIPVTKKSDLDMDTTSYSPPPIGTPSYQKINGTVYRIPQSQVPAMLHITIMKSLEYNNNFNDRSS